jgi:hypothetical protein
MRFFAKPPIEFDPRNFPEVQLAAEHALCLVLRKDNWHIPQR